MDDDSMEIPVYDLAHHRIGKVASVEVVNGGLEVVIDVDEDSLTAVGLSLDRFFDNIKAEDIEEIHAYGHRLPLRTNILQRGADE